MSARANHVGVRQHEASRTLVKSAPELWAQCSDSASLARHLNGSFGEIRITRLEPETAVAWEGEHASGTVRLEPSGWGTRVILTARAAEQAGFLSRLRGVLRPRSAAPASSAADASPGRAPALEEPEAALRDALSSLGQAHHRPFSRR